MSLPLRCICGYQLHIDRLKKEAQWVEQDLVSARAERDKWKEIAEQLSVHAQKHDHDDFRTCNICQLLTKFTGMQRRGR